MAIAREFLVPEHSRRSDQLPFNSDAFGQVISIVQHPRIVDAMLKDKPDLKDPDWIILGEVNRLRGLAAVYHHRFYAKPLDYLQRAGLLPADYSLNELGPSFLGHVPVMPRNLQPEKIVALDNQHHIVSGAKEAVRAYQEVGLLRSGNYEIRFGDHTSELPMADVSVLSLVSQYESGEKGAVDWLVKHGEFGINGDVNFTRIPISREDAQKGILRVTSRRLPSRDTGIALQLEGQPVETPWGEVYKATVGFVSTGPYHTDRKIVHIPMPDDNYQAMVTVYEEDGKLYAEPWGHLPTAASTEDDIKYTNAFRRTLQDIYGQLGPATNYQREWDAMAGLGVPVYAAENGYYSAVMITTAKDDPRLSAALPWAILMRHSQEAALLAEQGRLREIGPDKTFKNLGEFFGAVRNSLDPKNGYSSRICYANPILTTTIITSNELAFKRLKAAA